MGVGEREEEGEVAAGRGTNLEKMDQKRSKSSGVVQRGVEKEVSLRMVRLSCKRKEVKERSSALELTANYTLP